MKNLQLSDNEFKMLSDILLVDLFNLAEKPEFLEEEDYNPKEYIDRHISLCAHFNIDFWHTIELRNNLYDYEQLKAIYKGISIKNFSENYVEPTQAEHQQAFLRALLRNKMNNK
jgi:hypothetical protein